MMACREPQNVRVQALSLVSAEEPTGRDALERRTRRLSSNFERVM